MCDPSLPEVSLPSGWASNVKAAVLHVISLAHYAITCARGWAANSINARLRLAAENDQLKQEAELLREEIRIKDARMAKIDPRRRPYYPPIERMAILELKAARAGSLAQAARAFLVEPDTIAAWLRPIDGNGPSALEQLRGPVNKFPSFVRYIVQRFKVVCPALGKVKIAQVLARAGLHLGVTTVGRMLEAKNDRTPSAEPQPRDERVEDQPAVQRVVTAKRPNHVWHVDLTAVALGGFWTPWLPFALPQRRAFCWWLALAVDHFSRRVMDVAIFEKQPTSVEGRTLLGRFCAKAKPKYVICDKGSPFWCAGFKTWCKRKGIRPRFGAVEKCGGIAVIERFIRTLKDEGMRRTIVSLRKQAFRRDIGRWTSWFNERRPHTALAGKRPDEAYRRIAPANKRPRWEPRERWPHDAGCAGPEAKVRGEPGVSFQLFVTYLDGQERLPVVELRRAA